MNFPTQFFLLDLLPAQRSVLSFLLLSIQILSIFYFQAWAPLSFQIHIFNCLLDISTWMVTRHLRHQPQQNPVLYHPSTCPSPGLHHLREWHHPPPQCSNQKHRRHPWSLFLSLHIPSIADSCWFQQTSWMSSRLSLVQGVHRRNLVLSPAKWVTQWVFSWFLFQLSNC